MVITKKKNKKTKQKKTEILETNATSMYQTYLGFTGKRIQAPI